jgi:hypothetical protein
MADLYGANDGSLPHHCNCLNSQAFLAPGPGRQSVLAQALSTLMLPHTLYHPSNLKHIVLDPKPTDVLLGRGRGNVQHPGNANFIRLCSMHSAQYHDSTRAGRADIIRFVVNQVLTVGRFLKFERSSLVWVAVDYNTALVKTGQALRYKYRHPPKVSPVPMRSSKNQADNETSLSSGDSIATIDLDTVLNLGFGYDANEADKFIETGSHVFDDQHNDSLVNMSGDGVDGVGAAKNQQGMQDPDFVPISVIHCYGQSGRASTRSGAASVSVDMTRNVQADLPYAQDDTVRMLDFILDFDDIF